MRVCSKVWFNIPVFLFTIGELAGIVNAQTGPIQVTIPNVISVAGATQATIGNQTFTNFGIVGMGRIPAGTRDFKNESIGGFSGMDLDLKTWRKTSSGYTGTLFGLPDRGPRRSGVLPTSLEPRLNIYSFSFAPYLSTTNLPAATSSQSQLLLTQTGGFLLKDFNNRETSSLEPLITSENGILLPGSTPRPTDPRISLDAEGVRFLSDRSFYVSDEYGSNVYYFDAKGKMQGVILPPAALVPRNSSGALSFSSVADPVTGRRPNEGIEGIAITPDGKKLVTLAQSATMQDSTSNEQDRANTRLMIYDISSNRAPTTPIAHYVMQLPIYTLDGGGGAPNRTAAQSELLALNEKQFLVLSRDALGLGLTTANSVFKSIMLVDISGATNIAGTDFETATTPISPGGVLDSSIVPVQSIEFVNMLNETQLTKFGENLNNVTPNLLTLGEKWEGMALAPVLEENAPQEFFLFVGNDNDFLSPSCLVAGSSSCSTNVASDTHVMIFRISLPTYVDPEYRLAMVTGGPVVLAALTHSATNLATTNLNNIVDHFNAILRSDRMAKGFALWAAGIYRTESNKDFAQPLDPRGTRGTFGIDYGLGRGLTAGFAFGVGEMKSESQGGFSAKSRGKNYSGMMSYVNARLFVNAVYSRGDLSEKDITRPAAYDLTAVGATDLDNDSVLVRGGVPLETAVARIVPIVDYRYMRSKFDSYVETGAAGGNMAVPAYSFTTNTVSVGAESAFHWNWHGVFPTVHGDFTMAIANDPRTVTLSLASVTGTSMASEDVAIPSPVGNFASAGVDLQGDFASGKLLWHAGYTAEFGNSDRSGKRVAAGLAFNF